MSKVHHLQSPLFLSALHFLIMFTNIDFRNCSYDEFLNEIAILDISDKSSFKVRQKLHPFLLRVVEIQKI